MSPTHNIKNNAGVWENFTVAEQLGNIGSEVHRALSFQNKDAERYNNAVMRALDLFDRTLNDPRVRGGRLKEINLVRELFCDAYYGGKEYGNTLETIMPYFDQFAMAAAIKSYEMASRKH